MSSKIFLNVPCYFPLQLDTKKKFCCKKKKRLGKKIMKFKVNHSNVELLKAFRKMGLELEPKLKWIYSQGRCCKEKRKDMKTHDCD